MIRTYPHAEATYEVVLLADSGFAVKVSIPDTYPTTVSRFETAEAAEAWIDQHKAQVESQSEPRSFFRKDRNRPT